jgi:hypothetical protein
MTLINAASDGLPNELIVLARASHQMGPASKQELLELCAAEKDTRLRGCLSKWTNVGVFEGDGDQVALSTTAEPRRGERLDDWTDRLPTICRRLALSAVNSEPLFGGDSAGVSADLVRGLSWLLAQNIFDLPVVWDGGVSDLETEQLEPGDRLIQNDTRWNGLRHWARFLGFANSHRDFFVDPTEALRQELIEILKPNESMAADSFITELSRRLPVFDGGFARVAVTDRLRSEKWAKPKEQQLSMSLSFALYRLELDQFIAFDSPSDTEKGLVLINRKQDAQRSFIRIKLLAGVR